MRCESRSAEVEQLVLGRRGIVREHDECRGRAVVSGNADVVDSWVILEHTFDVAGVDDMKPVMSQTTISQPELPTLRRMSALTINIPEPIIDPATIIVASRRPSTGLNFSSLIAFR